ncbi:MAG: hypothetical protein HKN35_01050 [Woeseia sp.]|nr:hypothetical protein [Woeseia sp.]MBT8095906.1 hypothetical protein [Woeseia sp.]NNE59463.1 hypothetical protein [Woeseia sp.]NNL54631.1 hypothetical protein [Woeseia sp.]
MPTKPQPDAVENQDDDEIEEFSPDETIIMSNDDDGDDELDVSMEVNVEKLMAEMDKTDKNDVGRKKEIRRRLEEIQELRSVEDTYSFDMNGQD